MAVAVVPPAGAPPVVAAPGGGAPPAPPAARTTGLNRREKTIGVLIFVALVIGARLLIGSVDNPGVSTVAKVLIGLIVAIIGGAVTFFVMNDPAWRAAAQRGWAKFLIGFFVAHLVFFFAFSGVWVALFGNFSIWILQVAAIIAASFWTQINADKGLKVMTFVVLGLLSLSTLRAWWNDADEAFKQQAEVDRVAAAEVARKEAEEVILYERLHPEARWKVGVDSVILANRNGIRIPRNGIARIEFRALRRAGFAVRFPLSDTQDSVVQFIANGPDQELPEKPSWLEFISIDSDTLSIRIKIVGMQ